VAALNNAAQLRCIAKQFVGAAPRYSRLQQHGEQAVAGAGFQRAEEDGGEAARTFVACTSLHMLACTPPPPQTRRRIAACGGPCCVTFAARSPVCPWLPAGRPVVPTDFEDASWSKLLEAVVAIHTAKAVMYTREELYEVRTNVRGRLGVETTPSVCRAHVQAVSDLCMHNMGSKLYGRLEGVLAAHVASLVGSMADQTEDPQTFLALVHDVWSSHCSQMVRMSALSCFCSACVCERRDGVASACGVSHGVSVCVHASCAVGSVLFCSFSGT
jgi:hypothetical protein